MKTDMDNIIGSSETESATQRLLEHGLVRLALIWVVWTLVGLFFSSQIIFSSIYMEKQMPLGNVFFWQMSICYLWALSTPLVLWLARRFRIDRDKWARRLVLHSLIGVALSASMSAIHYPIFRMYFGQPEKITLIEDADEMTAVVDEKV